MKVFISWSGERSRVIAEGLNSWLPKVIQAVKPFYSPEIEKGTKGIEEINKTLEGASFGIICLTSENLKSEWIHYEAGALSKIEGARIWTLLHNLKHSDIVQPLAQFQHTLTKKSDIYKLLDSINAKLSEPLDKSVLRDSFERWWSDFEEILEKAEKAIDEKKEETYKVAENIRSDREILNELLELARTQQRINSYPTAVELAYMKQEKVLNHPKVQFSLDKETAMSKTTQVIVKLAKFFANSKIELSPNMLSDEVLVTISPSVYMDGDTLGDKLIEARSNIGFRLTSYKIVNADGFADEVPVL